MKVLLGGLLLATAVLALFAAKPIAKWLGTPYGWRWLWESFRGQPGVEGAVYKGYEAYTTVAGWFWFLVIEGLLVFFGLMCVTGNW